jgi:CHAT domain-containing protein/Big-like domain-containing protein
VSVLRSPLGEVRETTRFPFDAQQLAARLEGVRQALYRSRGGGAAEPAPAPPESGLQTTREFGRTLFDVLFTGEVGSLYAESQREARKEPNRGLRVKLRAQSPELAAIPWEFLLDQRRGDFICLSSTTPLVRYLESPNPPEALAIKPPLRILGMIAAPDDWPALDVSREKQRIEEALAKSRERGLAEISWLPGQTWQALTDAMGASGGGPWHVFHFIGHGGFDEASGEGYLVLATDAGKSYHLGAMGLSRLLGDHETLRLAVLNACEGAKGSGADLFTSTAAILVRRGLPAVVSMQQEISDRAAIEFSRELYCSLSAGSPVDAAVSEGRKAVSLALPSSIEWATPVLHMRAPSGVLFAVAAGSGVATRPATTTAPEVPRQPAAATVSVKFRWGRLAAVVLIGLALLGAAAWIVLGRRGAVLDHIVMNRNEMTLQPGDSFHVEVVGVSRAGDRIDDVGRLEWSSSRPGVATRDSLGFVRALAPGSATITARTASGLRAATDVTVQVTVGSVEVEPRSATIPLGRTFTFRATVRDAKGGFLTDREVRWRSSNGAIAALGPPGVVEAYAPGTAKIEARVDRVAGLATVTVVPAAPAPAPVPPPAPAPGPGPRPALPGLRVDYLRFYEGTASRPGNLSSPQTSFEASRGGQIWMVLAVLASGPNPPSSLSVRCAYRASDGRQVAVTELVLNWRPGVPGARRIGRAEPSVAGSWPAGPVRVDCTAGGAVLARGGFEITGPSR